MRNIALLLILTLVVSICPAQTFDVKTERAKGARVLATKSCISRSRFRHFHGKYFFNDQGQIIRSKHRFAWQKRAIDEYLYDQQGRLTHEITVFDINNGYKRDTIFWYYELDEEGRVTKETKQYSSQFSSVQLFSEFNENGDPNINERLCCNGDTITTYYVRTDEGYVSEVQYSNGDTLWTYEFRRYNNHGDLVYSLIPSLVGREDESLAIWIDERYAAEEMYHYRYDLKGRWKRKYLIYEGKKYLLQKRSYRWF